MLPPSSTKMKQMEWGSGRGIQQHVPCGPTRGFCCLQDNQESKCKTRKQLTNPFNSHTFISLKIQTHSKPPRSQKGPEAQLEVGQGAWGKPQLLTQEQLCQSITADSTPRALGQALKTEKGWRYGQKITWDAKQGSKWRPSRDPSIPKQMLCTEPALQLKPCA